jgi:vitamin B12 transporter
MLPTLLLLLAAGAARPCVGQAVPADTARRTVRLPEAPVQAAITVRSLDPTISHWVYETRLEADALRRLGPGASLAAVLAYDSPLTVRQYGPGQLASLSVRGTSAQHVATLWQGFNISFPTLGQVDLSLLPAAALTRATLQHGPDGASVGSGSVGGVLRLVTNDPDLRPHHDQVPRTVTADASVSAGSFGQQAISGRIGAAFRQHAFNTSVQGGRAENDFSYRYPTFKGWQTDRQVNAATRSYSVTHDHQLDLTPDWRLTAAAWLTGADRQLAPPLNTPNTDAHEADASQRLALGLTYREHLSLRLASLTDVINYRDRLRGVSDSRSQSWQAHLESQASLPRWHVSARGGLEAQHFRARADGYGSGLKTENRAAAFGALEWLHHLGQADQLLLATLSVRQAAIPHQWVPLTPTLKLVWSKPAWQRLRVWSSVGRAYRAPTLNERYWQPGGNPGLRPELSRSYELGLAVAAPDEPIGRRFYRVEVVAFDQDVQNWVQWTPDAATGLWSPRNLRRVRSRGVEGSAELRLTGSVRPDGFGPTTSLRLAGQVLQTHKIAGTALDPDPTGIQLPYVPPRTGSATLVHTRPVRQVRLSTEVTGTLISQRNTNASGTELLPGYGLLNAALAAEWPAWQTRLHARLDAFNLLSTVYQSQTNRPMPGRSWQVTLGVAYR